MTNLSETGCHVDEPRELLGRRIVVTEPPNKKELSYMIVSPENADPGEFKVSVESPLVLALKGVNCGDHFEVRVGRRSEVQRLTYRLVRVEDLPIAVVD